jgi:geranylgeranyl diphosphate synthase, type I
MPPGGPGEAGEAFASLGAGVRRAVEARLAGLFEARRRETERYGGDVQALLEAVRELTMRGGKRLRPAMLVAAYRASGGPPDAGEEAAVGLGVALELLQTYLLIHDDWMDGDAVRRGGPSVHVMLGAHFGSEAKGNSSAILAGDYANALALEVAAGALGPGPRASEALVCFSRVQQDVVFGQQLDISSRSEDVELMHALKTGSYTVRGPLELGAICAGATAEQRRALGAYAGPLGVAFQLRDDLLGVFGDPVATGKPAGDDLREGKRTVLVAHALAGADDAGRHLVESRLGDPGLDAEAVDRLREVITSSGAVDAVEADIARLAGSARMALKSTHALDPEAVAVLDQLIDSATTREH